NIKPASALWQGSIRLRTPADNKDAPDLRALQRFLRNQRKNSNGSDLCNAALLPASGMRMVEERSYAAGALYQKTKLNKTEITYGTEDLWFDFKNDPRRQALVCARRRGLNSLGRFC